ncbi:hypothetical protein ALC56_13828 [Trachymyrmex septentrionalis]|uniref:Uncharacterized protein n=1 Tax=Trachymyrmex septentrionalis TaxID=34720 RepID=A0A195EUY1_9HYME|nr:hypothetical protein ALC56_13828 [Trachymyrmex septentrionalis]
MLPLSFVTDNNLYFYTKDDDGNFFYAEFSQGGRRRWPTIATTVKVLKVALPGRMRKFVWRSSLSHINISQRTQEVEIYLRLKACCRKKKLPNESSTLPSSTTTNALDAEALAIDDTREAVNDENYKLDINSSNDRYASNLSSIPYRYFNGNDDA